MNSPKTQFAKRTYATAFALVLAVLASTLHSFVAYAQTTRAADLRVEADNGVIFSSGLVGGIGAGNATRSLTARTLNGNDTTLSIRSGSLNCSLNNFAWSPASSAEQQALVGLQPQGILTLRAEDCSGGAPVSFELSGIDTRNVTALSIQSGSSWQQVVVPSGATSINFTLTEGGFGDTDATRDGILSARGALIASAATDAPVPVPGLNELGAVLLALLIASTALMLARRYPNVIRNSKALAIAIVGLVVIGLPTSLISQTSPSAILDLLPTKLFFRVVAIDTQSGAQSVVVTNRGTTSAQNVRVSVGADFTQTNNCPQNLTVGSSCTVQVTFFPRTQVNSAPTLASITPSESVADGTAKQIAISGTNLAIGAVVLVNGQAIQPSSVTTTQVVATIPAALTTNPAALIIKVSQAGIESNALTFTLLPSVTSANAPIISSVAPGALTANGVSQNLNVRGSNFGAGTQARIGGTLVATTRVSSTELTVQVPATVLNAQGALRVDARASDGQLSNPLLVAVDPAKLPSDPATNAPSSSKTTRPTLDTRSGFIWKGPNAIQTGVTADLNFSNVALVRGKVVQRNGQPLSGVTITVRNKPELGSTLTRADGLFDLAVMWHAGMVLEYRKPGYLSVQRPHKPRVQTYLLADDVVMIPLDENVTRVDLGGANSQIARGGVISDESGRRQATLFVPAGTRAEMTLPSGGKQPLSRVHVRATEYTVGTRGPETMPGALPENSGYTYAVELSADEVIAAGAKRLDFDKPLSLYVDNYLKFPVGEIVPVGWYDYEAAQWQASDNGRVIKVLSVASGKAVLDVTGSGISATAAELQALGINDDELTRLAELYASGAELWRSPITHFTPWDCNWPYGPPPDWEPPGPFDPDNPDGDEGPKECGLCTVYPVNQYFTEEIPVVGTPFSLNYGSARMPGYLLSRGLELRVTGNSVPQSLLAATVRVTIEGQKFEQRFEPLPNRRFSFDWDGKDAMGRPVRGFAAAQIDIEYEYKLVYYAAPKDFVKAWNRVPTPTSSGLRVVAERVTSTPIKVRRTKIQFIAGSGGEMLTEESSIGGWTLTPHSSFGISHILEGSGEVDRNLGYDYREDFAFMGPGNPDGPSSMSRDGKAMREFNLDGRHLRTIDHATGVSLYRFEYDNAGRIVAVVDRDNRATRIERDGDGRPTQIVSPYGQTTRLTVGGNGYVTAITNPAGESYRMEYASGGLLAKFIRPSGKTTQFAFDARGRLTSDTQANDGKWVLEERERSSGVAFSTRVTALTSPEGRLKSYTQVAYEDGRRSMFSRASSGEFLDATTLESKLYVDEIRNVTPDGTVEATQDNSVSVPNSSSIRIHRAAQAQLGTTIGRFATGGKELSFSIGETYGRLSSPSYQAAKSINGNTWTTNYDAATKQWTYRSPTGIETSVTNDGRARPTVVAAVGLANAEYEYDSDGRLIKIKQVEQTSVNTQDERSMSFTYHGSGLEAGYLASVTNAAGETTRYNYDAAGRLVRITRGDGGVIGYTYDVDGKLIGVTPAGRSMHAYGLNTVQDVFEYLPPIVADAPKTSYSYDLDRKLVSVTRADGQLVEHKRDTLGRLVEVVASDQKRLFQYDSSGRIEKSSSILGSDTLETSLTRSGSLVTAIEQSGVAAASATLNFKHNNDLNVEGRSVQSAAGKRAEIAFEFDRDQRLTKAGPIEFTRNGPLRSVNEIRDRRVITRYGISGLGELRSLQHLSAGEELLRFSFRRDKAGRIVEKIESRTLSTIPHSENAVPNVVTSTYGYKYDLAGRLVEVLLEGVPIGKYSYDPNGNRVTETNAPSIGAPKTAATDAQDRMISCGAREFSYDADGRLTQKRCTGSVNQRTQRLAYNKLGQLERVTTASAKTVDYLYDALGRRVTKKVNGVYVHGYIYESQLRIAAQLDASGNVTHEFIYGEKTNVPEAMILPANTSKNPTNQDKTYRLLHDHLGSVRLVIDVETGAIAQELEYDAWGLVLKDSAPGFQPFGFAGGLYDTDTRLTRFGSRDYDAQEGRWTTKDPRGLAGGPNLYLYANADPVNFCDPTGEIWWVPIVVVGGIVVGGVLWAYAELTGKVLERAELLEEEYKKLEKMELNDEYLRKLEEIQKMERDALRDSTRDGLEFVYKDGIREAPGSRLKDGAKKGFTLFEKLEQFCKEAF
jgi:RHS repeat-associated protein